MSPDTLLPECLWDLDALRQTPNVRWQLDHGRQQIGEVLYESEPYRGRKSEVFARVMLPDIAYDPVDGDTSPVPAVVCVHGGGGKSFYQWNLMWAARGYASITMDLGGMGADGTTRLPTAGPGQSHTERFHDLAYGPTDVWSYHAIAAVMRATSLLASLPQIDPLRIGLTGISWGGYLASLVAGLDDRLAWVAPVYGCGHLIEQSAWKRSPDGKPEGVDFTDEQWAQWDRHFDPRHFISNAAMPMLFVTGATDFAYPPASWQKTTEQPVGPVARCVRFPLMHGHEPGWAPVEIGLFADSVIRNTAGLVVMSTPEIGEGRVMCTATAPEGVAMESAALHFTDASCFWSEAQWNTAPAQMTPGENAREAVVTALLPDDLPKPSRAMLNVTDRRNAVTSSGYIVID